MSEPAVRTILVADQDPIIRLLVSHIFGRRQFAVDDVGSLEGVEEMVARTAYDAILLDARLLDGDDGWIPALIAKQPSVARRMVLMSSQELTGAWNVHAMIRKPLELDALVEAVDSAAG